MKKIILASASPRRKEILKQMGVQFSVLTEIVRKIHKNRTGRDRRRTVPEKSLGGGRPYCPRLYRDRCRYGSCL